MSTKIAWTDKTWNPVTGCAKVSSGCKNCYAEGVANRFWATQYPEVDGRPRRFTDVLCHPERLERPLHWTKPRRVFVNSMSDLFHEDVPDEFIDRVFAVMALSPQHTFQVLTKRPERMRQYISARRVEEMSKVHRQIIMGPLFVPAEMAKGTLFAGGGAGLTGGMASESGRWAHDPSTFPWPLPNVWLGVSIEDQETADARIPELLATPAAVRWVSLEPQLGPVDFTAIRCPNGCDPPDYCNDCYPDGREATGTFDALQADWPFWVVQGFESGPKARPGDVQWARDVRDQCKDAGTAYFLKQLGRAPHEGGEDWTNRFKSRAGSDESEWPADLRQCRAWPKVPA